MADQDTEEIEQQRIEPVTHPNGSVEGGDAAVESVIPDEPPGGMMEPEPSLVRRIQFHASWLSIAIWTLLIALLVAFFAFGSVRIYPRNGLDRRMRVDRIWALFRDDLPTVYHQSLLKVFFYGAIALMVIGMAWMLFLALGTRTTDAHEEPASNRAADTVTPRF